MTHQDSGSPSIRAQLAHSERATGSARLGPTIALGIAASFAALIAVSTDSLIAWVAPAALAAFAAWWIWVARITVAVDRDSIHFAAPLFRRTVPRETVSQVRVTADDGINPGILNWIVVPTEVDGERFTRINMGGAAAVTFTLRAGKGIQLVVRDLDTANRLAETLRA